MSKFFCARGIKMNNKSAITKLAPEIIQVKQLRTLFFTFLWFIALLIIPEFIFGVLFGSFVDLQQANNSSNLNSSFRVTLLLLISLCSPLIIIPMLYKAINKKTWQDCVQFLALHKVNRKVVITYTIATFIFWLGASTLSNYLNLPVEQFILDVKTTMDNFYTFLLAVITICLIIPIMEETIVRGWLFTEIAQTKLGKIGALILTSLIFTIIHGQYTQESTFLMIFLFSLLLGFMRYKTNNLSYAIFAHILFNSLTMVSIFFL